jgi:predicted nucleic acid-binding protein
VEVTRLLLDTSAYSAFMRGHPEIKHVLQQAEAIYFNPIVLGELRAGFRRGRRLEKNEETLGRFMDSPRVHLVSLDEDTSERYAVIVNTLWTSGTPIPTNDIWIAASAMQHGLSILTTDEHYLQVPQVLVRYVPAN